MPFLCNEGVVDATVREKVELRRKWEEVGGKGQLRADENAQRAKQGGEEECGEAHRKRFHWFLLV